MNKGLLEFIRPGEKLIVMGRPPTVATQEVLRQVALHPEPVVTARDINAELGLKPDSARERLKSLAADGYLSIKKPGGSAMVFWMTDEGRDCLGQHKSAD